MNNKTAVKHNKIMEYPVHSNTKGNRFQEPHQTYLYKDIFHKISDPLSQQHITFSRQHLTLSQNNRTFSENLTSYSLSNVTKKDHTLI